MALKGLIINGKYLTNKQVIELARKDPEWAGYAPKSLVMMAQNQHGRPDGFSITELLSDSKRNPLLSRLVDYYSTPEKLWYSTRGNLIHSGYEAVDFGTDDEVRWSMTLPSGIEISGKPDEFDPATGTLLDYKTSKRLGLRKGHQRQLNAYAALLRANGYNVKKAYVAYTNLDTQRLVPVKLVDNDSIIEELDTAAQVMSNLLSRRVIIPRDKGCHPACRYYCPFYKYCVANSDWQQIEGDWTLWGDTLVADIPEEDKYDGKVQPDN